jgi:hypothetical protein
MKPIHKYNNGNGATLCNKCKKIICTGFSDELYCKEHSGKQTQPFTYKLVRTHDNLTKYANKLTWVGWNTDGTYKEKYDEPTIGASLVLDFLMGNFTWMTTAIKTFSEDKDCLTFTTQNSEYKLYKK